MRTASCTPPRAVATPSRECAVQLAQLALLIIVLLAGFPAASHAAIAPRLAEAMRAASPDREFTAWVFLAARDLDPASRDRELRLAEGSLDPRARWRRTTRGSRPVVSDLDLPLGDARLAALRAAGLVIRARSRWLNAVSVTGSGAALRVASSLPFVSWVSAVWTAPPAERLPSARAHRLDTGRLDERRGAAPPPAPALDSLDYGLSYGQLEQIQVPELHAIGLDGTGVRVGMLDTGFRLTHPALAPIHVLAQYDFVNGDSDTANQDGQDVFYQDTHGTLTLSLLAGWAPGIMIGPAYHSDFVLAKTEVLNYERPIEEDYWVEGIEWLESWGCDIVSSSLGYFDFDDPYPDYTYADMDGNTAVTTRAADIAASLGLVVCNCLGNYGNGHLPGYTKMIAPSDGDSVLGIGAVDTAGAVTSYSSRGPTYDGRTKPDLCARGDVDVCADATSGGYTDETGTSCSTPLVAGVCALLLQSHPEWGPMDLAARLKATADHAANPDTLFGWGIVRPYDLLAAEASAVGLPPGSPPVAGTGAGSEFWLRASPNPSRGDALITVMRRANGSRTGGQSSAAGGAPARLAIYDLAGRRVRDMRVTLPGPGETRSIMVGAGNEGSLAPGLYLARIEGVTASTAPVKLVVAR